MTADSPQFASVNRALAAHVDAIMAEPGVVGAAVGLLDDGVTPCVLVLVERATPELRARLPEWLDGHPVVVEESGTIRPLELDEG